MNENIMAKCKLSKYSVLLSQNNCENFKIKQILLHESTKSNL